MAIRNIVKEGDDTLTKTSRTVTEFDKKLAALVKDMKDTLKKADGLGLAAPQVGVLRRVVIVLDEDGKTMMPLINPEIVEASGEQEATEGCLSVPGIFGRTKRPAEVTVKAFDEKGKEVKITRTGMTAVCCCHEIDHLNGILFREHVEKYLEND